MLDFKQNFFASAAPAPTMPEIMFTGDPKYRRDFGTWLYINFDILASEYKKHGRFLTLDEIENPLN